MQKLNYDPLKFGVIAIVDDDEPLHEALGSILKAAGFPINTFSSAEDFLNSSDRESTTCLILDVRLPGQSGIELQRQLLADHSRMPVIFICGHADAALRDVAMKAGATDFLSKPLRSDVLLTAIRSALAPRPDQGQ